jgi:F0F1-type ATP synthase membrane subunit b/b'
VGNRVFVLVRIFGLGVFRVRPVDRNLRAALEKQMKYSSSTGKTIVENADVRLAQRFNDLIRAADALGQGEIQKAANGCKVQAKAFLDALREGYEQAATGKAG